MSTNDGMRRSADVQPAGLGELLRADNDAQRSSAWDALISAHSRLILRVAHSLLKERDDAMDAYAYVLGQLSDDDYRRLRTYGADGRCKFTTWLVVVARRCCIDLGRQKYGRGVGNTEGVTHEKALRRQLVQLAPTANLESLEDEAGASADDEIRIQELMSILRVGVSDLPAEDRLMLKLRFNDELSAPEIATILGMPSQFDVYRRLKSIFAKLRSVLESRGVTESSP